MEETPPTPKYVGVSGVHKDTVPLYIRFARDWIVALSQLAAQRTADEARISPYTVAELIREAVAKTYFLRKGEHIKKFREEESTYGETKKYL